MATSFDPGLSPGMVITGKWKQGSYRIDRLLGEGANGKVYLVEHHRGQYALKVGSDAVDLQSEVNVLQSLALQTKGSAESFLVEVDDFQHPDGRTYPFYVMRYVRGMLLADYLEREGSDWFPLVGFHLLGKLANLHEAGWVFGDLKMENVLVADYGRSQLVDYGGVTAVGKSVRQFTEIYDRGYWSAGSRKADAGYDLFSFAVLFIQLFERRRFSQLVHTLLPQNRVPEELLKLVRTNTTLSPLEEWFSRAFAGEFASTREAAAAWQLQLHQSGIKRRSAPAPRWMKRLFIASALLLTITIILMIRVGM
ncbi:serine/threonine protein kinase [Paenibacillus abyssi]|uniref:non-specific serine/threonine protein kinase n=1 Tax=Paenibacillus abyssi TaxID=1340531 RepID=A0A917LHR2_9BACL|nr:serine/threonine protein kinase [Paenibacillus abyssi]GGG24823.1 hypothetical protein GCM10010916_46640 [Paenibacillus abyssi]